MQKSVTTMRLLARSLATTTRGICSTSSTRNNSNEKIVASVLFEILPVVIPKSDHVVYAFQEFSFRWKQQCQRQYPDKILDKSHSSVENMEMIKFRVSFLIRLLNRWNRWFSELR